MADAVPNWPGGMPPRLQGPISRIAEGLPPTIGVMQILLECAEPAEAEVALKAAIRHQESGGESAGARRLLEALGVLQANPQAFAVVRSVMSGLDHQRSASSERDELAYWAAAFDRAARQNPEASVALYSLGNAGLLEAATEEVAGRLREWGLVSSETECLDLGCGIGRFERALGTAVARIVGLDISEAMLATARRRCHGLANVEFRQVSGRDLSGFDDGSFGLVLAVDSFPYMVQSGPTLAERMLSECARVLRPAGQLLILNYSYRGDVERDRSDLSAFAEKSSLELVRNGAAEFSLWDGVVFQLRKP